MQRTVTRSEGRRPVFWAKLAAVGFATGAVSIAVARYLQKDRKVVPSSNRKDNGHIEGRKTKMTRALYGGEREEAPSGNLWDVNYRGFLPTRDPVRRALLVPPFAFLSDISFLTMISSQMYPCAFLTSMHLCFVRLCRFEEFPSRLKFW